MPNLHIFLDFGKGNAAPGPSVLRVGGMVGAFRYVWEGRGRRTTTRGGRCNPHKYTRYLTHPFLTAHALPVYTATKGRSPWTSSPSSRPRRWTCASRPSGASTRTVRTGAFIIWIDEGNFSTRVIYGTPAVSQSTASFDLGARAVIDLSSLLLIHANCKGSAGSQKQCPI